MSVQIPVTIPKPIVEDVCVGSGTKATTIRDLLKLVNWLQSRQRMAAPISLLQIGLTGPIEIESPMITHRRFQTLERVMAVRIESSVLTAAATVRVQESDGTGGTLTGGKEQVVNFQITSPEWQTDGGTLQTQASTEEEYWLGVASDIDANLFQTAAWDASRRSLVTTTADRGGDPEVIALGQPLTRDAIEGVIQALADEANVGPRQFVMWTKPAVVNGSNNTGFAESTTSTSFVTVFDHDGVPVLARQVRRAATTEPIIAKVCYSVSGGTAEVRAVSSQNGNSNTVTLSSTTPAWSDAMNLDVDCEDLSHATGLQDHGGTDWDMLNFEFRKITSGTVFIYAAAAWEDGP